MHKELPFYQELKRAKVSGGIEQGRLAAPSHRARTPRRALNAEACREGRKEARRKMQASKQSKKARKLANDEQSGGWTSGGVVRKAAEQGIQRASQGIKQGKTKEWEGAREASRGAFPRLKRSRRGAPF